MINQKVAIIGVGNLGRSIAERLLETKTVGAENLILSNKNLEKIEDLSKSWKVKITDDNKLAVRRSSTIILCVKPQNFADLVLEIKNSIGKETLIVSMMTAISTKTITALLENENSSVVRIMTNLALRWGEAMSIWMANKNVNEIQRQSVRELLDVFGKSLEAKDDREIDRSTVICGSGPAYFYYLAEHLERKARKLGFSQEESDLLVRQTLRSVSKTIEYSSDSFNNLRKAVSSKGGITEAAIRVFGDAQVGDVVDRAIDQAIARGKELSKYYDKL